MKESPKVERDRIIIEAVVSRFVPNAMTDHYGHGGCTSYDATDLRILAPESLEGRTLTVFHSTAPPADSPLRRPKQRLRFSIDKGILSTDQMVFDGALERIVEL